MCARLRTRRSTWMKSVNQQAANLGNNSRLVSILIAIVVTCLLSTATASAQMAEDVFKNVQVLKGIPVDQFMETMGFFSASLALNCTSCHGVESASDAARFADDPPLKKTARKMILMVRAINRDNFAGAGLVTCYSCHRGGERPKITPSLADQYGT